MKTITKQEYSKAEPWRLIRYYVCGICGREYEKKDWADNCCTPEANYTDDPEERI